MNITREEIGTLNEMIKVQLKPDDYTQQYETELKKYRKSVNIPGFRPGNVPTGLIKKKFGRSILVEELNKIVSGSLQDYITEQKIDILGSPIPTNSENDINSWDNPSDFEFAFEIGLAPEFKLELPPKKTFEYLEIEVDDERVNTYMDDVRRKYGKFSNPEEADETCILYGDFSELDEKGEVKESGINSKSALAIDLVKNTSERKKLIGAKKGDTIIINLSKAFKDNDGELSHMLNVSREQVKDLKSDFNFVVDTVNHIEKAELNQELFDKIYGEGTISSEEEMKEKIKAEIAVMFEKESDNKLKHDLDHYFLDDLKISLPDEFLKKWLMTSVEKPLPPDQVEKEYPSYSRSMKMRLVENRIFRDQELKISEDEIKEKAKEYILSQFQGYGSSLTNEIMDNLIVKYLEKRESVDRIIETLSEEKVFKHVKSVVNTNKKTVSYDDFVKAVQEHHKHHH